jgi:hypothetical protein
MDRRQFLVAVSATATVRKAGEYPTSQIADEIESNLRQLARRKFGREQSMVKLRERLIVVYDTDVFGLEWEATGYRFFVTAPAVLDITQATDIACKLIGRFNAVFGRLNSPAFEQRGKIRV